MVPVSGGDRGLMGGPYVPVRGSTPGSFSRSPSGVPSGVRPRVDGEERKLEVGWSGKMSTPHSKSVHSQVRTVCRRVTGSGPGP